MEGGDSYSSDSSADAGSEDSGGIPFDLSWVYDDDDTADASPRPTGAGTLQERRDFDERLKELFFGKEAPRPTPLHRLRELVAREAWFVPLADDGTWDTVDIPAGRYRLLVGEEPAPSVKRGTHRGGRGGRLLPIFAEQPATPVARVDGRGLARALPTTVDGLLVHGEGTRELGREHFAALRELADACDIEDMLAEPGPGQAARLLAATWLVRPFRKRLVVSPSLASAQLVEVYTHRDRAFDGADQLVPIAGEELFRLFAEDDDVDGLIVNRGTVLGHGATRISNLLIPPGIACGLLEGQDRRPGAHPLPARSRKEIELWLNMRHFPSKDREWVETPGPAGILVRVGGGVDARAWRAQETLATQPLAPDGWSPPFVLEPGVEIEGQLGTGPTRILCAGLLASQLGAGAWYSVPPERYWRPGRWLLFGRFVRQADREQSRKRLALATELARLLPPDSDRVPRSAILTVEGARLLRDNPRGRSRAWIEATRRQAERYTHRWVWRG